jgi:uncharacterized protein YecE (DUF72 family)
MTAGARSSSLYSSPYIGCAGWSVPATVRARFPPTGTQLERYAAVLPAVEINTSFYRPHKPETYARWRDSVPERFRFAVKMPRTITHHARLHDIDTLLVRFLDEVGNLHDKLGCLLVQLPPSLAFDAGRVAAFFERLRAAASVPVVCEPRHASWFSEAAGATLSRFRIARVVADPPAVPQAMDIAHVESAVAGDIVYVRLHGAPVIYHSRYEEPALDRLAQAFEHHRQAGRQVWCIFDNTASGAAMPNALSLLTRTG